MSSVPFLLNAFNLVSSADVFASRPFCRSHPVFYTRSVTTLIREILLIHLAQNQEPCSLDTTARSMQTTTMPWRARQRRLF